MPLAPALLTVHWYLQKFDAPLAFSFAFAVLGIVPAILSGPIFGRRPVALGLSGGTQRPGFVFLAVGIPIALIAGYVGAGAEAIGGTYPMDPAVSRELGAFATHAFFYFLYYLGFEYFFRGFLLLGTAEHLGPDVANLLQSSLATMVHIGHPTLEVAAAFPASLAFGWITLRTGSIWYALTVHWVVGVSLDWFLLA